MKRLVYILMILLLCLPINLFSQKTSWIAGELIISLKENLINLNTEKTFFTAHDIKSGEIINSEKLNTYLVKSAISNLELHPSFKKLQGVRDAKKYKGITLKNIDDRVFVKVKFTNKTDLTKTIEELQEIEGVYNVSRNYIQTMDNVPNDYYLNYHPGSSYGHNWGFYNWYVPANDINMETAWNIQTGSPNIKVAVIDNGIDYNNPDLGSYYGENYKVAGGYNFISQSLPPLPDPQEESAAHGTKVAGVIGGLNNNKNFGLNFPTGQDGGISGIAGGWSYNQSIGTGNMGVKLLAYRTPLTSWGNYLATWQSRIDGADIINYSRGGESSPLNVVQVIWDAYELDGILYCSSMGNTQDWQTSPDMESYPAALNDIVVGVGAVDQNFNRISIPTYSWESAYGSHIDLVAPGIGHYSTDLDNQFNSFSGTSESSPMVAGAAALLKSQNPNLKARDIEQILKLTATDVINDPGTGVGWDNRTGYGVINVGKALQSINSPNTLNFYTASGGTSFGTYQHSWSFMVSFVAYPTAIRHEVRRSVTFSKNYIEPPKVWGRQGLDGTVGASSSNPNYEIMWCDVVPESITTNGCELVTYVYKIFDGYSWFWYPCQPNEVVYSYAVAGKPVTPPVISSLTQTPDPICSGSYGYVYCNLSQGNGTLTYNWSASDLPAGAYITPMGNKCKVTYSTSASASKANGSNQIMAPLAQIYCTVSNSAGSDNDSMTPSFSTNCGGCPTLAFEENGVIENENPMLTKSVISQEDVIDYYLIQKEFSKTDKEIKFIIHEPEEEHTYLDQIELLEVKVNPNEYVAVTENGEVISYKLSKKGIEFINRNKDDLENTLSSIDDNVTDFSSGDSLIINAETLNASLNNEDMYLLFVGIKPPIKVQSVAELTTSELDKSTESTQLYARPNKSVFGVKLGKELSNTMKIKFHQNVEVDFISIVKNEKTAKVDKLKLAEAVHSESGNVVDQLSTVDEKYSEILPGEKISFVFESKNNTDEKVSYILKSVGRYEEAGLGMNKKGNEGGTNETVSVPTETKLIGNYPNPFNPTTQISYQLKDAAEVTIKIYDVLGKEVKTLVDGFKEEGYHQVSFDASSLSSGIYFYTMKTKDKYDIQKMLLVR